MHGGGEVCFHAWSCTCTLGGDLDIFSVLLMAVLISPGALEAVFWVHPLQQ